MQTRAYLESTIIVYFPSLEGASAFQSKNKIKETVTLHPRNTFARVIYLIVVLILSVGSSASGEGARGGGGGGRRKNASELTIRKLKKTWAFLCVT